MLNTCKKILLLNYFPLPEDMIEEIKQYTFHNTKTLLRKKMLEIMSDSFAPPVMYRFQSRVDEKTTHIRYNGLNCKHCGNYITVGSQTYDRMEKYWRFGGMWCLCLDEYYENDDYDYIDVEDYYIKDDYFSWWGWGI